MAKILYLLIITSCTSYSASSVPVQFTVRCRADARQMCLESIDKFCEPGYTIKKEEVEHLASLTFPTIIMELECLQKRE